MPHSTVPPGPGESPIFDTPGGTPKTLALLIGTKVGPRVVALERTGRYVIDRDPNQDIVIDDKSVSRRHANVVLDGDVFLPRPARSPGRSKRSRR